MQVTRLKRGWRLHLTDNEMEALKVALDHGLADFDDPAQSDPLPNGVKRTLRSDRWRAIGGPLSIDDDRRSPSPTPTDGGEP